MYRVRYVAVAWRPNEDWLPRSYISESTVRPAGEFCAAPATISGTRQPDRIPQRAPIGNRRRRRVRKRQQRAHIPLNAFSVARDSTSAPIILFPNSGRTYESNKIHLIVPCFTPPEGGFEKWRTSLRKAGRCVPSRRFSGANSNGCVESPRLPARNRRENGNARALCRHRNSIASLGAGIPASSAGSAPTHRTPAPKLHVPPGDLAANWMPHQPVRDSTPAAIDALAGFLKATGWRLIYGLNFGNSTPERAAAEAAYVQPKRSARPAGVFPDRQRTGPVYQGEQRNPSPGMELRGLRTGVGAPMPTAVTARVPGARFGGPDVAASSDWVVRFCEKMAPRMKERLTVLTGHYYAEGPPGRPASDDSAAAGVQSEDRR